MAIELKMPALSPTMEEGKLARWLVKEGDEVSSGDILAEIETDKATMEFEAVDEGKVGKIVVPEGTEGVKVGTVIALIEGEDSGRGSAGKTGRRPEIREVGSRRREESRSRETRHQTCTERRSGHPRRHADEEHHCA
jgi:pyruvate dehydrogenase E1 component beta subunit